MYKAVINNSEFTVKKSKSKTLINNKEFGADIFAINANSFHLLMNNNSHSVVIISTNIEEKQVLLSVNRKKIKVELKDEFDELLKSMGLSASATKKVKNVKAPMPGLITKIIVQKGDTVKKGDSLLVLEAMKMENVLKSPADGTIKELNCKAGAAIEKNEVLITFA